MFTNWYRMSAMTNTSAKVILAVGITALMTAVVLIAGFMGYLYLRPQPNPVVSDAPAINNKKPDAEIVPRSKGSDRVAAANITKVTFSESTMGNISSASPTGYFSNINVQNYASSSKIVTFSADGVCSKKTSRETTTNGVKKVPENESFTANIDKTAFSALAEVLADNDFSNEPDSRFITSLPIRNILTIHYNGGVKTINTGHLGKNSLEAAAMLKAVSELDRSVNWKAASQ